MRTSNTDADKESPGGQHVEHADGVAMPVGAGGEGGEDDEDGGGGDEGVGSRPVVRGEAKDELAEDGAGKGDAGDDALGARVVKGGAVLSREGRVDRTNNLVRGGKKMSARQ